MVYILIFICLVRKILIYTVNSSVNELNEHYCVFIPLCEAIIGTEKVMVNVIGNYNLSLKRLNCEFNFPIMQIYLAHEVVGFFLYHKRFNMMNIKQHFTIIYLYIFNFPI